MNYYRPSPGEEPPLRQDEMPSRQLVESIIRLRKNRDWTHGQILAALTQQFLAGRRSKKAAQKKRDLR